MPDEIVQQTAIYGIEPLEFDTFQLDFPSISPFLGDTWWLETMEWAPPETTSPQIGSSGAGTGTPVPGSSGIGIGAPSTPTTPITSTPLDPGQFGTSGSNVGKAPVIDDAKYEEFFSENPVILLWDDGARYLHLHLLGVPAYRENAEFLAAAREFERRPDRATKWYNDWFFSRPNILEGMFSSPAIYVGINVANMIPLSLKRQQVILDAQTGICPPNPQSYNYECDIYSTFKWNNDELKRLVNKTRWIWQQWQPDWRSFAIEVTNMLQPGGHWASNLGNFTTFQNEGGFPPASFDIYVPSSWNNQNISPNRTDGYPPATYLDSQLGLPGGVSSYINQIYWRNYTPFKIPVFVRPDLDNPVMTANALIWNKSDIRNLVFG